MRGRTDGRGNRGALVVSTGDTDGRNMNKQEVVNLPLLFMWCLKIHRNHRQRLMSGWQSYSQSLTQTHPFPVCVIKFVRGHAEKCTFNYLRVCVCACMYIFMKPALLSHTVGVSRSFSLAINHCRQLISGQSACQRTVLVKERPWMCLCTWLLVFALRSQATIPPLLWSGP